MKEKIKIEVQLDENNLPEKIKMHTEGKTKEINDLKAIIFSGWSLENKETIRLDLWTKEMMVNEMFIMYHQTLISMATSLEKSTGNNKLADALRDYCSFFAEQTKIINSKN